MRSKEEIFQNMHWLSTQPTDIFTFNKKEIIRAMDEYSAEKDKEIERLKRIIKKALEIKELWTLGGDVSIEHEAEARVLDEMASDFEAALSSEQEDVLVKQLPESGGTKLEAMVALLPTNEFLGLKKYPENVNEPGIVKALRETYMDGLADMLHIVKNNYKQKQ